MAWEEWRDDGGGKWDATGSGWDTSGWDAGGWSPDPAEERRDMHPGYFKRTAHYCREAGNGYRPKANDPDGWTRGENRPNVSDYETVLELGEKCSKKLRMQFKAYTQRESQKMATEDRLCQMLAFAEREQAKKEAAAALHHTELEHQGCDPAPKAHQM